MSANAVNVAVSVEVGQEYAVQEIHYDGQEVYTQPPSMSEKLTKLAQKIDFTVEDDDAKTVCSRRCEAEFLAEPNLSRCRLLRGRR